MRIKIIKDFRTNYGWIRKGEEFTVRKFYQGSIPIYPEYQVVEGSKSGTFVPSECFIEIPIEKTFTEKEWNDLENHYLKLLDKEREEKKIIMLEFERKLINVQLANEEARSQIRKWYLGALIREEDKTDPDGYAKEAIEEVVHYLGGDKILADISSFCRHQLAQSLENEKAK